MGRPAPCGANLRGTTRPTEPGSARRTAARLKYMNKLIFRDINFHLAHSPVCLSRTEQKIGLRGVRYGKRERGAQTSLLPLILQTRLPFVRPRVSGSARNRRAAVSRALRVLLHSSPARRQPVNGFEWRARHHASPSRNSLAGWRSRRALPLAASQGLASRSIPQTYDSCD